MQDTYRPNEGYFDSAGRRFHVILLRNALLSQAVTVGVSATRIPATPLTARRTIIILNNSDNDIYIGNADVTIAAGYVLRPQDTFKIDISDEVDVYGIAGSNSECRILEGS